MPGDSTAVREVLEDILKASRKQHRRGIADDVRTRLAKNASLELTDEELTALAESETWRLDEAFSMLPHAKKKFPDADFSDIEAILKKLQAMIETDPRSADVLLPETMKRFWKRIDELRYPALSARLKTLTTTAGEDIAAAKRDVRKAIADWTAELKGDDEVPDPAEMDAVQDMADAAVAAMERWRDELGTLRKALEADVDSMNEEIIGDAEEVARQDCEAPRADLDRRLKALAAATVKLREVKAVRLTSTDEFKIVNRFSREKSKLSDKLAKLYCTELSITPEGKWRNVLEFLEELKAAGDDKTAQAKASKQKPSVAMAAFLQLADATAWGTHGIYLRERANDFDGKLDKAAKVLKALAAINEASATVNQWLVRLAVNGTPAEVLARYHAARAELAGVSLPGAYAGKLDTLMADLAFDPTIWTTLKSRAGTKYLFLSSVVAYLKTENATVARQVADDYYGLTASTRPTGTTEGRIAEGLTSGVIDQNKQRTSRTTVTASGHAYKYSYVGGFVRAAWELHVHENRPNLYPAWKSVSTPGEYVAGRDTYTVNGALRSLLK